MEWHKGLKENNYVFNFQQEILTYCRSDVHIFCRCYLEFCKLFCDVKSCLTIAPACNLIFRTNFLQENSIAILPSHGYHPKIEQSNMALRWLSYIAEKNDIYIQHKRNGRKKSVGRCSLDDYHNETSTAHEFYGCFWHGNFSLNKVNQV